ncbi:MAG TPA: dodecin family protein [Patescibacteria group bacterium]|nr:dodecin family protein [Patescibacteria group bacterium]
MAVVKIVELIGTSETSWEDAAKHAVDQAAKTIRNITGVDVVGQNATIQDNKITEFKANVKIAFLVER